MAIVLIAVVGVIIFGTPIIPRILLQHGYVVKLMGLLLLVLTNMASYQDIESRLQSVEDKLDFTMKAMRVMNQSAIIGAPPRVLTLLDLYLESKRAGLTIATPPMESEHA